MMRGWSGIALSLGAVFLGNNAAFRKQLQNLFAMPGCEGYFSPFTIFRAVFGGFAIIPFPAIAKVAASWA